MGCYSWCLGICACILVPLIAVLLSLHLQCVREKQEELENKFIKPYRPEDTVIENYTLPFIIPGITLETHVGIWFLLAQNAPCCVMKLLGFLLDIRISFYKSLNKPENLDWRNITFYDARKQSPGTFNETGFALITLDEEAKTTDWRTSILNTSNADVIKFHRQMEPHIRKLYPGVKRFEWLNNLVHGGGGFGDVGRAVESPHLDLSQNDTARVEFYKKFKANEDRKQFMDAWGGDDKFAFMLGIFKPILPGKLVCDHPLAIMDASTFSREHDQPHGLHFDPSWLGYSFFGGPLHTLYGSISYDPKQRWYYYPFQNTKEVLLFHHYSQRRFWVNPHTSFLNRNCPAETEGRVSIDIKVLLYF